MNESTKPVGSSSIYSSNENNPKDLLENTSQVNKQPTIFERIKIKTSINQPEEKSVLFHENEQNSAETIDHEKISTPKIPIQNSDKKVSIFERIKIGKTNSSELKAHNDEISIESVSHIDKSSKHEMSGSMFLSKKACAIARLILDEKMKEELILEEKEVKKQQKLEEERQRQEQLFESLTKDEALKLIHESGKNLKNISKALRDDKDVVLAALRKTAFALEYASENLKDDEEILLFAVKQKGNSLKYGSYRLRDNKEIVLAAVASSGVALEYASDRLRNNRDIALTAINNSGKALQFVGEELEDDEELFLAAIKSDTKI